MSLGAGVLERPAIGFEIAAAAAAPQADAASNGTSLSDHGCADRTAARRDRGVARVGNAARGSRFRHKF